MKYSDLFSDGTADYGRRTRIVAEENENEPQLLVTRTLTVKQLVPLRLYTTGDKCATVDEAREYEVDLPEGDQIQAVIEAVANPNDGTQQMEYSVTVTEAIPGFRFGDK